MEQNNMNMYENEPPKKKKKHSGGVIALIAIPCVLVVMLICAGGVAGIYAVRTLVQNTTSADLAGAPEEKETETSADYNSDVVLSTTVNTDGYTPSDIADIVEEILPSVVCVNITSEITYSQFGQQYSGQTSTGSGSGVIMAQDDDNLYIVTNNHVVSDGSSSENYYYYSFSSTITEISVVFSDGTECVATLRGTDNEKDLAVIAVPLSDISDDTMSQLRIATIGSSDNIRLGETAIAIGNALGYGQSVTLGIISALNREVAFDDGYTRTLMQTDAAINPGNSGGGLFNANGELIGINSAKYSSTQVEGMGYAIPISDVTDLIIELIQYEQREPLAEDQQGFLGIAGQDITSDLASAYDMPIGVYVTQVINDSAAEQYGIHAKDIITKVNAETVTSRTQLTEIIKTYAAGETVTITLQRLENGAYAEKQIDVTLASRAEYESSLEENTSR